MAGQAAEVRLSVNACIAALACVALCACDELPNARLVNNSGATVVVVEKAGADGSRKLELALGVTSKRLVAYGTGRRFDIVSGACVYSYAFPPMGVNFAWRTQDGSEPDYKSGYPIGAQLEPDFRVYLLPATAKGTLTRAKLDAVQGHGFPLKPSSKTCA